MSEDYGTGELSAHPDELARLHQKTARYFLEEFDIKSKDDPITDVDPTTKLIPIKEDVSYVMQTLSGEAVIATVPLAAEVLSITPFTEVEIVYSDACYTPNPEGRLNYQPPMSMYTIGSQTFSLYPEEKETLEPSWTGRKIKDPMPKEGEFSFEITRYECAALFEIMTRVDDINRWMQGSE